MTSSLETNTSQANALMTGPDAVSAPSSAASLTSPAALIVRDIYKRYEGASEAILQGVSLSVPKGASVALLGANGSGKSTLLRCCLRLVEPNSGEIELLGKQVHTVRRKDLRQLRRRTGFVFQKHNLVNRMSALSNVIHGAMSAGSNPRLWTQTLARGDIREQAMECLNEVGLHDHAARRADRLSGGQSQRVAIARTLMQQPEIVFADEPAASLDPVAGEEVMALFARLIRAHAMTLVFASHDLTHAKRYADYIVALRGGLVVMDGCSSDVDADQLARLYER